MRVYTAVRHSTDPTRFYGDLWSRNFYPALRQLGCEIVESNVDLAPASAYLGVADPASNPKLNAIRGEISAQLLDEVRALHAARPIDLFLSYFYNAHCDPSAIANIRTLGIPTVNFYCNSMYQFHLVDAIAPAYDFAWHTERDARPYYELVGANPIWIQMGADPTIYRPLDGVAREASACFVGQRYCDRDRWLAALVRSGVPIAIYGTGWGVERNSGDTGGRSAARRHTVENRLHGYTRVVVSNFRKLGPANGLLRTVRQGGYTLRSRRLRPLLRPFARGRAENLSHTFNSHEVILGFSNVWSDGRAGSKLLPHVRLRDFEAPMARSCYITGYSDEIGHFYKIGTEIDTYRSAEELVDKTRYYLRHPRAAEKMREAGYQRARRDHTWEQRFRQLFNVVGLSQGK